jgi:hypothetical protein
VTTTPTRAEPYFEHISDQLLIEEHIEGTASAVFSPDRAYRYLLTRRWGPGPLLVWIMLNPSTADALKNDPTIRRVMAFARRDGYGGIAVVNLFALRSPEPRILRTHPDPVGPLNDAVIRLAVMRRAVVAWGAGGTLAGRDRAVCSMLSGANLRCLGWTKSGMPLHPLARGKARIPDDAPFYRYSFSLSTGRFPSSIADKDHDHAHTR